VADGDCLWLEAHVRGDLTAEDANSRSPPTHVGALAGAAGSSFAASLYLRFILLRPYILPSWCHEGTLRRLGMPAIGHLLGFRQMSRRERDPQATRGIEARRT
jgi:hypothetical protein